MLHWHVCRSDTNAFCFWSPTTKLPPDLGARFKGWCCLVSLWRKMGRPQISGGELCKPDNGIKWSDEHQLMILSHNRLCVSCLLLSEGGGARSSCLLFSSVWPECITISVLWRGMRRNTVYSRRRREKRSLLMEGLFWIFLQGSLICNKGLILWRRLIFREQAVRTSSPLSLDRLHFIPPVHFFPFFLFWLSFHTLWLLAAKWSASETS